MQWSRKERKATGAKRYEWVHVEKDDRGREDCGAGGRN